MSEKMSTSNRTTKKGGKNNKTDTNLAKTKTEASSKTDPPKSSEKVQPTAEQMRIAEIMDTRSEDPSLKEKIKEVMDLTQKSELEVMSAFMDNDNDANLAVNSLLEGTKNEWSTSVVKKKKNRTASTTKSETVVNNHVGGEAEDWDSPGDTGTVTAGGHGRGQSQNDRERPRQRGSGPPRMRGRGSLDNRGWRGRENKENERNLEEGASGERGNRRGGRMSNGPGRSGRGGRGGGRLGPRTFQSRDKSGQGFPRSIDTWNNPSTDENSGEKMENWTDFPSPEDWDNEEYTGSLADSKVFTPSSGPEPSSTAAGETSIGDNSDVTSSCSNAATATPVQAHVLEAQQTTSKPSQLSSSPVGVNTLTSAQSQYFNQITQASESFKSAVGLGGTTAHTLPSQQGPPQQQNAYPATQSPNLAYTATSVAYTSSNYGVTVNSYNSSHIIDKNSVPKSKPVQRTRIQSSSKIPSSAVEMPPGDTVNSGIGFLDVQFGGLEFGSSDSGGLETSTGTENTTPTPPVPTSAPAPSVGAASSAQTPAVAVVSVVDAYATSVSNTPQQTSIASALAQTQKLTMGESMLHTETAVSSGYGASQGTARSASTVSSSALTELSNTTSKTSATVDVPLAYGSVSEQNSIYQTPTAYQKTTAASSYQPSVSTYNSSNYSTPQQVTSTNSGYSSSQSSGYTSSSAAATNSGYGSSTVQNTPSVNSYPNANSYGGSQQTSYPYQSYPTASGGYQGGGQGYPPQSVYGATAGTAYPYQNSYPANTPASASTQQNHKITTGLGASSSKDSQYESGTVSNVTIPSVTTVSATPSLGLSATSQTAVSTKVTAMSTGSKSGVVPSIPPGVPQMLGTQYIMSQGGLPYFHQQPVYSFEDLQMLQQRIPPHMNCVMQTTSYYDMAFQQAPTSLATGRDGSLTSVAYSMSDGRFGRADNNASPVPSTLSQQNATQTHQQPMINPALPPGYAYVYGNMIPGNFQYGAPTIYPMAPTAATGGHGNSNSGQYKGPGGYGSAGGYSSGYEAGATDYSKVGAGAGAYTGAPTQTKTGTGVGGTPAGANPSSTSTDLAANMYSKSHAALSKVNSYDKQSFHSATPPPFNLTNSQNTGLAPSGAYPPHLFIPPMAPHQQHHSAALMHQPLHQDGGSNTGPRSQTSSQPNKAGTKQNYSPSYSQLSTHGYLS